MVLHSAFGTVKRNLAARPDVPRFDRHFFDGRERVTAIGSGACGGKAAGLLFMRDVLARAFEASRFPTVDISIPTLTVITTELFDRFMTENRLYDLVRSDASDERIALAFQQADLPVELPGDLRALITQVHTPLAIRSSSLLEDALSRPFAGVYATKMIPNNQPDADTRFRKLAEAVKFVYASTFFRDAKRYVQATERTIDDEKMAVIVQEVVGRRHRDRFYPDVAGVGRSYSFYRTGAARPEDGVITLALGLGRTIVDDGLGWNYSPAYPTVAPPYGSIGQLLDQTQNEFWAVNMGKPPAYDPINEIEYLMRCSIADAEGDGTLRFVASTFDPDGDRLTPGLSARGPRALTFAPILQLDEWPLNDVVRHLLQISERALEAVVEIEFAVTFDGGRARLGFLQVRPMVVSDQVVDIGDDDMRSVEVLVASDRVMGNGLINTIRDVVYVKPDRFEARHTAAIADALGAFNLTLMDEGRPYLLIGLGRWGSADPWLGIPVGWGQIAGARALVEASLPAMNVELSQGSHFFHNISSFEVSYFSVRHDAGGRIAWDWLDRQPIVTDTEFVRHVRLARPLVVKVDGRTGRGVILTGEEGRTRGAARGDGAPRATRLAGCRGPRQ